MIDPQDIRYERMARKREAVFAELRRHYGHLPPPVRGAIMELCEYCLSLGATPDEAVECTVVTRPA